MNEKAIILIHEFWGVNNQMKKVAERLRAEGYEVQLADLYKGKVAKDADEARKMKEEIKDGEALAVIESEILKLGEKGIPPEKIAIWGFCMGGSFSFLAAVNGIKAGAYVIYYGSRIAPDKDQISKISAPVFGAFGGQDQSIPVELVKRFQDALNESKKINEVCLYEEAGHAFFNEERPSYNETAANDAWFKTLAFLEKNLTS